MTFYKRSSIAGISILPDVRELLNTVIFSQPVQCKNQKVQGRPRLRAVGAVMGVRQRESPNTYIAIQNVSPAAAFSRVEPLIGWQANSPQTAQTQQAKSLRSRRSSRYESGRTRPFSAQSGASPSRFRQRRDRSNSSVAGSWCFSWVILFYKKAQRAMRAANSSLVFRIGVEIPTVLGGRDAPLFSAIKVVMR